VRLLSKLIYARNAYRVFPLLSVRPTLFRRARLKEVTGYSIYSAVGGWAYRLNFMSDSFIIGMFMGPAAVALWAVPRRLGQAVRSFTNQLNNVLLPVVVDSGTRGRMGRLRTIFIHGTKLSLFAVMPLAGAMFLLADPLIPLYVGNTFQASVPVAQILAIIIAVRVGNATASIVLRGRSGYRHLAFQNLFVAITNVVLSVWWIQWYGLIGQAMGTLVPVAFAQIFLTWPMSARTVGMKPGEAFRQAVWPTVWPLPAMAAPILFLKSVLPPTLLTVVLCAASGTICYLAVAFGLAMGAEERGKYLTKLRQLIPTRWPTSLLQTRRV
jgi:O-antigen/teichoic acid export membrane protein